MKLTRTIFALVGVGALALTGCSASATPSTSASSSASASTPSATTVEDTLFRPVARPAPPDGELTVVAMGWSDAEVALALGGTPVAVYDWQGFGESNTGVGPWELGSRFLCMGRPATGP